MTRLTSTATYENNQEQKEQAQKEQAQLNTFPRRRFKLTKTQRKEKKTLARQDSKLTPKLSDQLHKGYEKIMGVLERGCDVSRA